MTPMTRRSLLGGAASITAGGVLAGPAAAVAAPRRAHDRVEFHGRHQAGILTPVQRHMAFAAFDVTLGDANSLRELLRAWSSAAALMTAGQPAGDAGTRPEEAPRDTGEAVGLTPARLTVTFGVAPELFDGRFGLAARRPAALRPLEALPGEALEPARTGGDLCVQACADDRQVAFHTLRELAHIATGAARMRWMQTGFASPRNLMGFKDGTNNLDVRDRDAMRRHVWVGREETQPWMRGGTYLVARRVRILVEEWDRSHLDEQQEVIGRAKLSGDVLAEAPTSAHIRLAAPSANDGIALLRRGYSFGDGTVGGGDAMLDAGLFFVAFTRAPSRFAAIQRRLGASDALNEYIRHEGGGLFAVPGGARPGGFVFDGLI